MQTYRLCLSNYWLLGSKDTTYEDVNNVPAAKFGPDQVDDLLQALSRNGVAVVDDPERYEEKG